MSNLDLISIISHQNKPDNVISSDVLVEKWGIDKELADNIIDKLTHNQTAPLIDILNDQPTAKDTLNVQSLVLTIANIILSKNTQTPITIGIHGKWGTGKTSVLKMIEEQAGDLKFPCIWLSAWCLQNPEELFTTIQDKLQESSTIEKSRKDSIPTLNTQEWFTKLVQNSLSKINNDNARMIIFIDDLDRALPDQITMIIRNLKLILEVTGCVFVLAMDMDIVANAIEEHYYGSTQRDVVTQQFTLDGGSKIESLTVMGNNRQTLHHSYKELNQTDSSLGHQFLEKIIQLQFKIPPLTRNAVDKYLKDIDVTPEVIEIIKWAPDNEVLNPRRLKRYLNWLSMSLQLIVSVSLPYNIPNIIVLRSMALLRDYPQVYDYLIDFRVYSTDQLVNFFKTYDIDVYNYATRKLENETVHNFLVKKLKENKQAADYFFIELCRESLRNSRKSQTLGQDIDNFIEYLDYIDRNSLQNFNKCISEIPLLDTRLNFS